MEDAKDTPPPDMVDCLSLASMLSMAIGIVLILFGLLVPTNYVFDPELPARQMEGVELFYFRLSLALEISLVVGMGLVAIGGIIQTGIIVRMYFLGELDPRAPTPQPPHPSGMELFALHNAAFDARNYGTSSSQSSLQQQQQLASSRLNQAPGADGFSHLAGSPVAEPTDHETWTQTSTFPVQHSKRE